jgi:hypothetical protein
MTVGTSARLTMTALAVEVRNPLWTIHVDRNIQLNIADVGIAGDALE